MRDLFNNLAVVKMLSAIVGNDDNEGTPAVAIDTADFDSAVAVAIIGTSGDTLSGSLKIAVVAEESADDVTFTPITDADQLQGATPDGNGNLATIDDAAEDDVIVKVGYLGFKRYFRLRLDFTGTHTNVTPIAMIGLRGHPQTRPVAA
jgi:hypothetical protein